MRFSTFESRMDLVSSLFRVLSDITFLTVSQMINLQVVFFRQELHKFLNIIIEMMGSYID